LTAIVVYVVPIVLLLEKYLWIIIPNKFILTHK